MITREPSRGSGSEPKFVKDLRGWGGDVVKDLRSMRPSRGTYAGGGQDLMGEVDWSYAPSFVAYFRHREEYSSAAALRVDAGLAVRESDTITVATVDIAIPASGDLYVYVTVALAAGTGSITSNATRPNYRSDADTVNVVLGVLTHAATGPSPGFTKYYSWTPYHVGEVIIQATAPGGGDINLSYPFEGSVIAGNKIRIGANRAESDYYFHDHIVVGNNSLALTALEDTAAITADSYVYYTVTKTGSTVSRSLKKQTVATGWPDSGDGAFNYVLGVALANPSVDSDWIPHHISGHIIIPARFS